MAEIGSVVVPIVVRNETWDEAHSIGFREGHRLALKQVSVDQRALIERLWNEALAIQWDDGHGNRVVAIDALRMVLDEVAR